MGLEHRGFEIVWANDIEPIKQRVYSANFGSEHYRLSDVREVRGGSLPDVDLATASFPCVDLSLAGWRRGLAGDQSGMFWEFTRVLTEMSVRPQAIMLENVPAFLNSHGGKDLAAAIGALNDLGYACDLLMLDARAFVPQSRARLFVVGRRDGAYGTCCGPHDPLRPRAIQDFVSRFAHLSFHFERLQQPKSQSAPLSALVDRGSDAWWGNVRRAAFLSSLSPLHAERLHQLQHADHMTWRTAYRRTRNGRAVWEIRADELAGCLRTARGGSSKQAVIEAGLGEVRLRWMSAREYARLQGAGDLDLSTVTPTQAMYGLGDAVCVPVIGWMAEHYLRPLLAC